jgi:hypothetical protein
LRPESTELDHHNLNRWLGPVQPLYFLSRPRPAPAMGPAGHALHGPSCEPETPHTTSPSGPRASSLHKTFSRPLACTARTRQGASAAWTLPRPSDPDWPGSGQYHQPGRTGLGPPCWARSSAHPDLPLQAPAGTCAARTLPRPSDSDRVRLARSQLRHRAAPHEPGRTRPTRSNAIPRESGIRLNPPPEILSRPPACHCQARRGTRCTDPLAGRRPGLDRAPVTQHRSCTPRARRELRRSRPLEHRHSGCTGATAASGDSDTPPWGPHPRDQTTRLAGQHRAADPQDGPRAAESEAAADSTETTTRRPLITTTTHGPAPGDSDQANGAILTLKIEQPPGTE